MASRRDRRFVLLAGWLGVLWTLISVLLVGFGSRAVLGWLMRSAGRR